MFVFCRSVLTLLCWSWFYTLKLQINPKIVMNLKTAHCDISPTLSLYFINVTVWRRWSLLRWPAVTLTSDSFTAGGKSFVCLFVGLVCCFLQLHHRQEAGSSECTTRKQGCSSEKLWGQNLTNIRQKHVSNTWWKTNCSWSLSAASSCEKTIIKEISHTQKCDIIIKLSFMISNQVCL